MVTFPQYSPRGGGFNAFASGMQAGDMEKRRQREDEEYQRSKDSQQYIEPALGGDQGALAKVFSGNPQAGNAIAAFLDKKSEREKAALKEASEFTTRAGMGVLSASDADQPALYATALAEAKRLGYDTSKWPQQWSPAARGWLQYNVNTARPFKDYFDSQGEGVAPIGPPAAGGGGGAPAAPAGGKSNSDAIAGIESGGRYDAVGPETGKGRAYGRYQVMDFNIGPWTREVLGTELTPQQFLASPQAQDAVFNAKFGAYEQKYGREGAARAWFAGEGGMNNPNAADVNGMTVARYAQKFNQAAGGPQPVMGTPPAAIAQSGAGAVPMPSPPPGMAVAGNPAPMPGGAAPPNATGQGGDVQPPAQAPGQPPMPFEPRDLQLPQGWQMLGQKSGPKRGVPIIENGYVYVQRPDGTRTWYPLPQRKEPAQAGGGIFTGNSVEARALNEMIRRGILTEEQALDLAAGKTITNPADGSMIFKRPTDLVGGAPAPAGGPQAPGGAAPAPSGGVPLTPPKPVQMTEGQANAALYADRMRAAEKIILENSDAAKGVSGVTDRGLNAAPLGLGTYGQSESYQKLDQAQRNFINAVLRRESGAVISDEEFENARLQYFPMPGNPESVLKQKAENRRIAIEGISRAAGPTYKPAEAKPEQGAADKGKLLFDARKAIEEGAPRDAVIKRLKEMGVEEEP